MEELTRAKKRALAILTDSDRTEKQLYDKLKKAGYGEEVVAAAIEYVKGFGYIDDLKYSVRYIDYNRQRKSRARLQYDLIKKGISKELLGRAFEEAGEWDERPMIRQLAERKLAKMDREEPNTYRKVASFLGSRGYQAEDIASVLGTMF